MSSPKALARSDRGSRPKPVGAFRHQARVPGTHPSVIGMFRQGGDASKLEEMPLPVVLAVEVDPDALKVVEAQLTQRYARDYRVICLGDPRVALQELPNDVDEDIRVKRSLTAAAPCGHTSQERWSYLVSQPQADCPSPWPTLLLVATAS